MAKSVHYSYLELGVLAKPVCNAFPPFAAVDNQVALPAILEVYRQYFSRVQSAILAQLLHQVRAPAFED